MANVTVSGTLNGTISAVQTLSGKVAPTAGGSDVPLYHGEYNFTPKAEAQVIDTDDKRLKEDIVINPIPSYRVSNDKGGDTFIIGG